jgi:hypothetical protein
MSDNPYPLLFPCGYAFVTKSRIRGHSIQCIGYRIETFWHGVLDKLFITREKAVEELRKMDIPAQLILDAAVGYYIEKVDMVLVGAEGVVESGGIINQVLLHN